MLRPRHRGAGDPEALEFEPEVQENEIHEGSGQVEDPLLALVPDHGRIGNEPDDPVAGVLETAAARYEWQEAKDSDEAQLGGCCSPSADDESGRG